MASGSASAAPAQVIPHYGQRKRALPSSFRPLRLDDPSWRVPLTPKRRDVPWVAVAVAMVFHLLVAGALMWRPEDPGAQAAGQGGIVVAFELAGASAGAEVETPGDVRDVESREAAAVDADVESDAVEAPKPVESEVMPPEPVPEVTPPPKPIEATEPVEKIVPAEPPKEFVELRPARRPDPPNPAQRIEAARADVATSPTPTETAKPFAKPRQVSAVMAGAGGLAPASEETEGKGTGKSRAGGGVVGAAPDYFARLRAWLEQHKDYPRRAQVRREQGTVMLRMAFVPGGELLSFSVTRSSGYPELDRAAEAMVKRAQPFPPTPNGAAASLEVVVPVSFSLR